MFYSFKSVTISRPITSLYVVKMSLVLLCMWYRGNISLRFPSNFEADASELLGNLEEIFPC